MLIKNSGTSTIENIKQVVIRLRVWLGAKSSSIYSVCFRRRRRSTSWKFVCLRKENCTTAISVVNTLVLYFPRMAEIAARQKILISDNVISTYTVGQRQGRVTISGPYCTYLR